MKPLAVSGSCAGRGVASEVTRWPSGGVGAKGRPSGEQLRQRARSARRASPTSAGPWH